MTLNFPSSPTSGQTYSLANGATYTWDGEKWKASNIPDSSTAVQTDDTPSNGEVLKWNGSEVVWAADNDTTYSTATSSTAGIFKVVDEDNMSSDATDAVPTQQSVKAYVDNNAGGLTEFTEADSETAPNATVHVSSLTSAAGSTNADVAIVPKGTGALLATIPDNTVTGGTKRGQHAVDLQTHRSFSDMVCSAEYSVISGGSANKIVSGGGNNVIAGGLQNEIANVYQGTISGGRFGDVTGGYGTILGGNSATAVNNSLSYAGFAGGSTSICLGDHNANASYSTCIGGYQGATKGRFGAFVIPAGNNGSDGDAQYQIQNVKKQTTDATQTTLNADTQSSSSSVWNTFQLHPNEMHVIKGTCVAAKSDYSLTKAWDFNAVVKWENGANAPVIVGTPNINVLIEETNSASWDISLDILTYSTAIASFVVKVTGQASTTIDWLCTLHSTELNTL